jgi:succinate dehydrogenase subunit D
MTARRSSEALWWSLFSAGGVMSALFLPVLVLLSGVVLPYLSFERGPAAYQQLRGLVSLWPVRLLLLAVIALSFFHAAHRIRHIIRDLGWRRATGPLSIGCYGGALASAAYAAWLLLLKF